METEIFTQDSEQADKLTPAARQQLLNISKFTGFISIVGFVLGGFIVLMMLLNGKAIMSEMVKALPVQIEGLYSGMVIGFLIVFLIVATILYFMFQSSSLLRKGVTQNDPVLIAEAFKNLRLYFTIICILLALGTLSNILSLIS